MSLARFQGAQDVIEVERTEKGCFCPTCGEKLPARRELKGSKPMTPAQKQKATAKFYAAKAKLLKQAEALGLSSDSLFPDTHAADVPSMTELPLNSVLTVTEGVLTTSGSILVKDLPKLEAGHSVPFTPAPRKPKGLAAIHQSASRVASGAPTQEQDPQLF